MEVIMDPYTSGVLHRDNLLAIYGYKPFIESISLIKLGHHWFRKCLSVAKPLSSPILAFVDMTL